MIIAMDYDNTYTADPAGWDACIALMAARGHQFVCVTGREVPPRPEEPRIPMPVICAGDQLKRSAAMRAGVTVDVWIDDCPGVIEPPRMLDFSL